MEFLHEAPTHLSSCLSVLDLSETDMGHHMAYPITWTVF